MDPVLLVLDKGGGFYLLPDFKEEVLEGFGSVQQLVPNLTADMLNPRLREQSSILTLGRWVSFRFFFKAQYTSVAARASRQAFALSVSL